MNLVRFLIIGAFGAVILGEFGKYPFGVVGNSLSLLDLLVGLAGGVFLIWKIGIKKEFNFPNRYILFLFFCFTGLLSLVVNNNFSGMLYLVRLFFYGLIFWIGFELEKENQFTQIKKIIIGSGIMLAISGFLQLLLFPNLSLLTEFGYDPHIFRLTGTFLDPNFLGAYLCIVYALCLISYLKFKQKKQLVSLCFLFLAILLTFSRSAWIMFGIINLFAAVFVPKKIVAGLVIFIFLATVFIPRIQQRIKGAFEVDISAGERIGSWEKGLTLFKMNPGLGIGFNNIKSVSVENNLVKPFTPDGGNSGAGVDSSWLLILATTGVLGTIIFGLFYFQLIWIFLKNSISEKKTEFFILGGVLIAFFVESQFINSLFYPPLMLVFFLITGAYYAVFVKKV